MTEWTNLEIWRSMDWKQDERVDNKAASAAQCFLSFWPLFQLDRDPSKLLAVVLMLTLQYIIPFDHGWFVVFDYIKRRYRRACKYCTDFKYCSWDLPPGNLQLLENKIKKFSWISKTNTMKITYSMVQSVLGLLWPRYSFIRL